MKQKKMLGIFLSIITAIFVFFIGINVNKEDEASKVFKVYLDGKTVGLTSSEDELLDLINEKQKVIKEKYNVEEVHPPIGFEIKETYTFNKDIITATEIYDIIQEKNPFTISGYTAKIKEEDKEPIYVNVLHKEDFEDAFKNVVKAFTGSKDYEMFSEDNQPEIIDVGYNIETIYWEENVTIKESLISVDDQVFTNANDISKYLLFGTLDDHEFYTVKEGDDISKISYNNKLSVEEFLVANPQYPSENVILTPGQVVNIALIEPVVTIVSEMHVVEDITDNFKVEYLDDPNSYVGTEKVVQEGENGVTRVTEKILYKNGQIHNFIIIDNLSTVIKPSTSKVISRGTKTYSGGTYINTGTEEWYWPTVSPYIITSRYGYRWGSHHNGIDISGSGFGSPIRSSTDGVVVAVNNNCPNEGRGLSDTCGGSYGNYIEILTTNGEYKIIYAHLTKDVKVRVGNNISRGQIIGHMGNSGRSSGTHLHYEIRNTNGAALNPCGALGC